MQMTGAEIVIACLKEQGVDTVFGYPGGTILNIYDALYKHKDEIRHVLTSHEQGAAHAADGYARATGKIGVCMATSGPGSTNLVTGIATAYMDSIPIVAITCNVAVPLLGKDTFQEVDIAGITMPITKYSMIVKDVTKLADSVRRAFEIAVDGRPGPVLVDITKDVTAQMAEYQPKKPKTAARRISTISKEDLENAAKMINAARRPLVFVGGGANLSDASEELRDFVHKIHAPVCDTLMGKGAFSGVDPLYMGMLGMHGTKAANQTVPKCDLMIAAGVRFSDRDTGKTDTFAENAKILQLDIDRAEINKNVIVDASVIGDLKEILKRLTPMVEEKKHAEWVKESRELSKKYPLKYDESVLTGPYFLEKLYEKTRGNAIMVTDVGQHQMWTAQYYKFSKPRTFLTSGGLGTMGYGLGAAIGAKVGCPRKTVVNIAGDGCFRMNMNELLTAVRSHVNIIEVVMDNEVLGMVRQWQTLFYGKRYSSTMLDDGLDYVKLAEAMGAIGVRVTTKEEADQAIDMALKAKKPVLIDVAIGRDDMVFPMAPAGKPIENAFDQDDMQND